MMKPKQDEMRTDMPSKALIHSLYERPMSGEQIEERSFQIIDEEAPQHSFSPEQWEVVRRMIHTTADFGLAKEVRFSSDAVEAAVAALRSGAPILNRVFLWLG